MFYICCYKYVLFLFNNIKNNLKDMKNYLDGITEEIINSHGIKNIGIIQEKKWKPRMIITQNDDSELIVDGDEEIIKFVDEKFKQK